MKVRRNIIEIKEELCNGCGECVTACAEGALEIIDGKAKLVGEIYCDGLGACLGGCPTGALKVIQREADEFDEGAVEELLKSQGREFKPVAHPAPVHGGGCPSARLQSFGASPCQQANRPVAHAKTASALRHWPVQIKLVPPSAPFLRGANLLVAADCVAYAYAGFHELLEGKALMIGCPKFDDANEYVQKFAEIFRTAGVKKITVVDMEVPCCSKLPMIVKKALEISGASIPLEEVIIGIQGDLLRKIDHAS